MANETDDKGQRAQASLESRNFVPGPAKGHRLSHNRMSKSLPEHLMAGMNAEHDVVLSMRLCEIRNHKYPESPGLPAPAKFLKVQSAPARFARSCSAEELHTSKDYYGSCRHRRRAPDNIFVEVEPFLEISFSLRVAV